MIKVPDEKTITGLTRSELITLVYALKKEREHAIAIIRERAARARERKKLLSSSTTGTYLDDGDLANFYDVLVSEIENGP